MSDLYVVLSAAVALAAYHVVPQPLALQAGKVKKSVLCGKVPVVGSANASLEVDNPKRITNKKAAIIFVKLGIFISVILIMIVQEILNYVYLIILFNKFRLAD